MPFDLSMWKLLVLGVLASIIFGPDRLPQLARDAGRMLRQFRALAQTARTELKSEFGDTIGEFDIADLNPRTFVRKHLLDDVEADLNSPPPGTSTSAPSALTPMDAERTGWVASGPAPFDLDAT